MTQAAAPPPPAPTIEKVKIISITPVLDQNQQPRTWTSGKQIKYNIMLVTLADNRQGEWMDNGKGELTPNMEVELEIKEEIFKDRKTLKFRYNKPGGGGGGYKMSPEQLDQIMRQNAMGHATNMLTNNPNIMEKAKDKERDALFKFADEIFQWIKTGKRPTPATKPATT